MKTIALVVMVLALCLPFGVRKQTQFKKQRIRKIAERIGIKNLFD